MYIKIGDRPSAARHIEPMVFRQKVERPARRALGNGTNERRVRKGVHLLDVDCNSDTLLLNYLKFKRTRLAEVTERLVELLAFFVARHQKVQVQEVFRPDRQATAGRRDRAARGAADLTVQQLYRTIDDLIFYNLNKYEIHLQPKSRNCYLSSQR